MAARLGSTKFAEVIEEIVMLTTDAKSIVDFGTRREIHTRVGEVGAVFMPLSIESMGMAYPDGGISVMHFYIQNGDVMMDPMVVVTPQGEPLEYQMDGLGGHYTRFEQGERGQFKKEINAFLDTWARNIRRVWLPMAEEMADKAA